MSSASKIIQAAAGNAGEALYVEDVFSTYLYDGNDTARDITNGVNLEEEGGLVWIQERDDSTNSFSYVADSERGSTKYLITQVTNAEGTQADAITSFNSDGFALGLDTNNRVNNLTQPYVSWTFRKAPKFFDVVTYTGNGSSQVISHNLGSTIGSIFIKKTNGSFDWKVFHRSLGTSQELELNQNGAAASTGGTVTAVSSSSFTVGGGNGVNASGDTYVAYLFAHNDGDGEFGESGDQDIIKCGSYTGGSGIIDVTLGWEPQLILRKRSNGGASNWEVVDNMRGMPNTNGATASQTLFPNLSNAESATAYLFPTATGFSDANSSSTENYIYIAIRRGPMKTPESGTEVFAPVAYTGDGTSGRAISAGFAPDAFLGHIRGGGTAVRSTVDKLRGNATLQTSKTDAEVTNSGVEQWTNDGFLSKSSFTNGSGSDYILWMFRRAPGFFDVVAYEGNLSVGSGSTSDIDHNLGVTPEIIFIKQRSSTQKWCVGVSSLGNGSLVLNETGAFSSGTARTIMDSNTGTTFRLGSDADVNRSSETYIAYLFATLPGVSKVGSYTGNGTSQTIDCGFSAGARFVMTKRTNTTGNWNVWDSERGIIAGNDPRLELNTTDAEDTGHDYIDPDNSGFVVNYVADDDDDSNVSGDEYIFIAVS